MGHPYYGRMAILLAASIRMHNPSIKIHLAYQGNALNHLDGKARGMFTSISEVPEYMTEKGYFQAKTFIYDLSPFYKTLYLDVDMIVWKDLTPLFKGSFNIKNKSFNTLDNPPSAYLWVNPKSIQAAYNLTNERWYEYGSEVILFDRSDKKKAYFDLVKGIYANPKVEVTKFTKQGALPDEFAFSTASAILKHYPETDKWEPTYFPDWHPQSNISQQSVFNDYYGLSIGSHEVSSTTAQWYSNYARMVAMKMDVPYWVFDNKKNWIPERNINQRCQPTT